MDADRADTYKTLDLALRIGEILLRSGAGAADVTATMLAVSSACGVTRVSADVTFVDLTLHHQPSPDEPAAIRVRRVTRRPVDYELLTRTDELVRGLVEGRVTRDEARGEVARLVSTAHRRHRWAVTVGLGVMGAGTALRLGGGVVVCLLAFVAACAIDRTQRLMARRAIPMFYQQAAGGLLVALIAVVAAATALEVNPSRVVTAGIVMMLAGIGLMGASQDAILGYPVTASARTLEAVLLTSGIIGGVGAGLSLRGVLGVHLEVLQQGSMGLAGAGVAAAGAAIASAAFAYASYAPIRALVAVGLVGGVSDAVATLLGQTDLGNTWGIATAAVVIGLVSYTAADRIGVPPLVVIVPSVVPLLPGLAIYRGLALLVEGKDGVLELAAAAVAAVTLAAGVILGQYIAQPVKKEARRLGDLPRPRLAGPWNTRGGHSHWHPVDDA